MSMNPDNRMVEAPEGYVEIPSVDVGARLLALVAVLTSIGIPAYMAIRSAFSGVESGVGQQTAIEVQALQEQMDKNTYATCSNEQVLKSVVAFISGGEISPERQETVEDCLDEWAMQLDENGNRVIER